VPALFRVSAAIWTQRGSASYRGPIAARTAFGGPELPVRRASELVLVHPGPSECKGHSKAGPSGPVTSHEIGKWAVDLGRVAQVRRMAGAGNTHQLFAVSKLLQQLFRLVYRDGGVRFTVEDNGG